MPTLRLAIAGVGNCASALLQGLEYYRERELGQTSGLLHAQIGGYRLEDGGAQLFARIDGDIFTIIGLPLLELLAFLRTRGVCRE